jgi:hypothetical protein
VLTVDQARLLGDPYLAEVMRRPRVWVFGDESALALS